MEERAKIIFKDGTELEVEANGSCFILNEKPEFPDDLSEVTIERDGNEEVLHNVGVDECASVDGRYWFTFIVASAYDKLESQVMYTALMTDTLIEEDI